MEDKGYVYYHNVGIGYIDSVTKLSNFVEKYCGDGEYIFRGQKNAAWKLWPKLARTCAQRSIDPLKFEESLLLELGASAKQFVTETASPQDEWDWLALAQHHGMSTRLLDWTRDPFIAAYFAVDEELPNSTLPTQTISRAGDESNLGAIWVLRVSQSLALNRALEKPWEIQTEKLLCPTDVHYSPKNSCTKKRFYCLSHPQKITFIPHAT